jgi:hypothetical protein
MRKRLSKVAISVTTPLEQSDDFRRGFSDTIKSAGMEAVWKVKARLEAVRPIVTRRGQIRRLGRGA